MPNALSPQKALFHLKHLIENCNIILMNARNAHFNTAESHAKNAFGIFRVDSAIRQSGNQAIRQSGNQAIRQSGNQAIIHIF
jgi:hypothetical protein